MRINLTQPFQYALDSAVAELGTRGDIVGILFFGSASRGEAGVGSDIDLYAITARDTDGSFGRVGGDVPIEISFGSLFQWNARMRDEKPVIIHAFANGRALRTIPTGRWMRCVAKPRPCGHAGRVR